MRIKHNLGFGFIKLHTELVVSHSNYYNTFFDIFNTCETENYVISIDNLKEFESSESHKYCIIEYVE